MGSDCTVEIDEGFINVRVGAIIMKDGKFLMAGNDKDDFLYSVGGRVKFGETSEQAVMREVFEETGVKWISKDSALFMKTSLRQTTASEKTGLCTRFPSFTT